MASTLKPKPETPKKQTLSLENPINPPPKKKKKKKKLRVEKATLVSTFGSMAASCLAPPASWDLGFFGVLGCRIYVVWGLGL